MRQIIGNAEEFYRLRVVTFDASDAPDLDWRADILWRRPVTAGVSESVLQRLEAVEIADGEIAWTLGEFATTSDAHAAMQEVDLDLRGMTKSQFEDAYLGCGTPDVAAVPMPERTPTGTTD